MSGDGDYIISTARAWRSQAFGKADEFVWAELGEASTTNESAPPALAAFIVDRIAGRRAGAITLGPPPQHHLLYPHLAHAFTLMHA